MSESSAIGLQQVDGCASERVLDAVARCEGDSPLELDPPLYDVIDPDALDALFTGDAATGTVEFTYLGHRVVVDAGGEVTVDGRAY